MPKSIQNNKWRPPFYLITMATVVLAVATKAAELELATRINKPVAGRHQAWQGHVSFVYWIDTTTIVYGGRSGFIKCHDLLENAEQWSLKLPVGLTDTAGGGNQIFTLDQNHALHMIDARLGKTTKTVTQTQLAKLGKREFIIPGRLTWVKKRNNLLVTLAAYKSLDTGILLNEDLTAIVGSMRSPGFTPLIAASENGNWITTASSSSYIQLWSIPDNRRYSNMSPQDANGAGAIDSPFVSNIAFDGDSNLIYIVDNSWATGRVHIYDTTIKKELTKFDSRNGHCEMDVNFEHSLIALTGTSKNLTVVDFAGRVLADFQNAATQRVAAIQFSPGGKQLAIGSWDGTVKIFRLKNIGQMEKAPQPK